MAGALDDAEKSLGRIAAGAERAFGPAVGEVHGRLGLHVGRGRGDALVEHHHDVAADRLLHLDAGFGREQVVGPVNVAFEAGAILVHGAFARKGKNLEAAGVGQHGPVPVHEAVDAAEFFKHRRTGPKKQVIGVGEEDAGAGGLESLDGLGLHGRLRANRHEDRGLNLAVKCPEGRRARF